MIHRSILGLYLRRTRGNRLTQEEVARAAGLDRSTYNAHENGRRGIEVEKVPQLAKALGVPAEEILALADRGGEVAELAVQVAELRSRLEQLEGDGPSSPADRVGRARR